ncbi:MAG: hypothetical protein IJ462_00095 [Clostridia bacterium]|nr:hypothetical protein [Clostridia bacterium]
MNKKSVLYLLLELVILIIFNIFFYMFGCADYEASTWISYVFIHLSFGMMAATPYFTRKNNSGTIFGFSLSSVSAAYFFVEFAIGLIFIFLNADKVKVPIIIQIVLAGIYGIILLLYLIKSEKTDDKHKKISEEMNYMRTAANKVKTHFDKAEDNKLNKQLKKVYEELIESPSRSHKSVKYLEVEILSKAYLIDNTIDTLDVDKAIDVTKDMLSLIKDRNKALDDID